MKVLCFKAVSHSYMCPHNEDIPGNVSGRLEKDYQADHVREIGHVKMEGIFEVAFPQHSAASAFWYENGENPIWEFSKGFSKGLPAESGQTSDGTPNVPWRKKAIS